MTTNYHTPITTGAPANASTVNDPLGQLDSALTTTNTDVTALTNALNILKSGFIGMIFASATDTAPTGMLACNGATYLKSAYPDLYDALDPIYQISATEFKVPDLRGRTIIGAGTGAGLTARSIDQSGGAETVKLNKEHLPPHEHVPNFGNNFIMGTVAGAGALGAASGNNIHFTSKTGGIDGGSNPNTAHENMQPFRVLNYWIVATL